MTNSNCFTCNQLPEMVNQIEDLKTEISVLKDEIQKLAKISFSIKGDIEQMITKAVEKYSEETCATLRVLAHGIKGSNSELVKFLRKNSHQKHNFSTEESTESNHSLTEKVDNIREVVSQSKPKSTKRFKKKTRPTKKQDNSPGVENVTNEGAIEQITTAREKPLEETCTTKRNLTIDLGFRSKQKGAKRSNTTGTISKHPHTSNKSKQRKSSTMDRRSKTKLVPTSLDSQSTLNEYWDEPSSLDVDDLLMEQLYIDPWDLYNDSYEEEY